MITSEKVSLCNGKVPLYISTGNHKFSSTSGQKKLGKNCDRALKKEKHSLKEGMMLYEIMFMQPKKKQKATFFGGLC